MAKRSRVIAMIPGGGKQGITGAQVGVMAGVGGGALAMLAKWLMDHLGNKDGASVADTLAVTGSLVPPTLRPGGPTSLALPPPRVRDAVISPVAVNPQGELRPFSTAASQVNYRASKTAMFAQRTAVLNDISQHYTGHDFGQPGGLGLGGDGPGQAEGNSDLQSLTGYAGDTWRAGITMVEPQRS